MNVTRINVTFVVAVMTLSGSVLASLATFDSFEEGFYGTTLVDGGITFFDVDARIGEEPLGTLAIDDVSEAFPLIPEYAPFFSSPNVFGMSAFGLGPATGGSARFGELRMTTGGIENFVSVDVFHLDSERIHVGNSIVLEAFLDGELVGSDAILLTECCHHHDVLSISGGRCPDYR